MANQNIIDEAVKQLEKGAIVAVPTETVYGLAVDAFNPTAIAKLYNLKQRQKSKPLAIAIASPDDIQDYVSSITDQAKLLIDAFWPGPLTLILPAAKSFTEATIGIRCSSCPIITEILRSFGHAIYLTSANKSGDREAVSAQQIHHDFGDEIFIVEGDECLAGTPSTIIDVTAKPYRILREGTIAIEKIKAVIGNLN